MMPEGATKPVPVREESPARGVFRRTAAIVLPLLLIPVAAFFLLRKVLPDRPALASAPRTEASPVVPMSTSSVEDEAPEVRGRVFDGDGNLVPKAEVRLVLPSRAFEVIAETTSDESGAFSFDHVGQQSFRLAGEHDPQGFGISEDVHLIDGETTEVTLVLSQAGAVHGVVVDSEDHPVAGANLAVEWPAWSVPSATSDESGAFA